MNNPTLVDVEQMLDNTKNQLHLNRNEVLLMYQAFVAELAKLKAEIEMLRHRHV